MTALYGVIPIGALTRFENNLVAAEEAEPWMFSYESMNTSTIEEFLREYALELLRLPSIDLGNVSKILSIPKSTLIAWKAHESRGTYGDPPTTDSLDVHSTGILGIPKFEKFRTQLGMRPRAYYGG